MNEFNNLLELGFCECLNEIGEVFQHNNQYYVGVYNETETNMELEFGGFVTVVKSTLVVMDRLLFTPRVGDTITLRNKRFKIETVKQDIFYELVLSSFNK